MAAWGQLGGVPGVPGVNVVIAGGGIVRANAARMAAGLGAHVVVLDIQRSGLTTLMKPLTAGGNYVQ